MTEHAVEQRAQETTPAKHAGGRPRLTFDLRMVEDRGRIQSTHAELAAVLGCSLDTVKDRLKGDAEFSTAYEKGLENGRSSLRRLQWKSATNGNITMQIWLGKQYLGQRDMHSAELSGANGEPLVSAEMVTGMDERTRALLRQLRGSLRGDLGAAEAVAALPSAAAPEEVDP